MGRLMLTGATGLVGANICEQLRDRGDTVRALVRDPGSASELADSIEAVEGDVSDRTAVLAAAEGVDAIIHCAAILGGIGGRFPAELYEQVNLGGTMNVLEAAEAAAIPIAVLSTVAALQTATVPVSETSPIPDSIENESPYTSTKRRALLEIERRTESGTLDARVIAPAGVYGPSPAVERALVPTSFDNDIRRALRGEVDRYARVPMGWSFVDDVVEVTLRSLDDGRPGDRFLAVSEPREAATVAEFLTHACELAGVEHRVEDVPPSVDPAYDAEFAGMARLARRAFPTPLYDIEETCRRLNFSPTPVDEGLAATIAWLRENGKLDPVR